MHVQTKHDYRKKVVKNLDKNPLRRLVTTSRRRTDSSNLDPTVQLLVCLLYTSCTTKSATDLQQIETIRSKGV